MVAEDHAPETMSLLLVEDDEVDRTAARRALGRGIEVVDVATLAEAEDELTRWRPDLVLVDLGLPDSDGLDTVRQVRARRPSVPIVVLTGREDEGLGAAALQLGAQDYVPKSQISLILARCVRHAIERDRFAAELQQAQTRLSEAQKLQALGQLAGGVAHDFNNLLTVIISFTAVVHEELPPQDPRREDLREVLLAGDRAKGLVSQLLAFSRQREGEPRLVRIDERLRGIDRMLRRTVGESIELVTLLDDDLPAVRIDPVQLDQVLLNLAVNARDAMPRGGSLTISIARGAGDRGDGVEIRFTDTGEGMPQQVRDRIFEPFFTTKQGGTGLGLSMCYGIVVQAGGEIEIESEPGQGSTFRIVLPGGDGMPELDPATPSEGELGGTETVLLVEDVPAVRRVARLALEREGYQVIEARHGEEAVRVLEDRADRIDLVLTDMVMPHLGGAELVAILRARWPAIRTVVMSGFAAGAEDVGMPVLQKPFSPRELVRRIRQTLDD